MAALSGSDIARYAAQAGFTGQGLTNIVAIAGRESGFDPTAYNGNVNTGDNSVGLTQINLIGDLLPARGAILNQLGYNVNPNDRQAVTQLLMNPLVNMQVAYVLSSGGTDFYPWGGYKGMSDTYGTDLGAAQQYVQQAGLDGGSGMANTTGGGDAGSVVAQVQQIVDELAQNKPDQKDYTLPATDIYGNPTGGTQPDTAAYQAALNSWMQNYTGALKTLASFQQQQVGLTTLPDGSVVATGDLTPEQANAINTANANNYADLLNKLGLSQYNLLAGATTSNNQNTQNTFDNTIKGVTTKMAVDNASLQSAIADISRWADAQQTAQNDVSNIQNAQKMVQQYGTTNGKTSFTGADLGGGVSALAAQANIPAASPIIQYPGFMTLNPVQDRLNSLAAMGVSNTPPAIPYPTVTAADIPSAPGFISAPTPPGLISPAPPPIVYGAGTGNTAPPMQMPPLTGVTTGRIGGYATP